MTDNPLPHADALKYEDWAGEMGARWLANLNGFESTIAPVAWISAPTRRSDGCHEIPVK